MQYAPVIIFAFNRLELLKQTVASLLRNPEAAESNLFLFVDGARPQREGENEKVLAVQEYVKTISGFKSVHFTFAEENKGLGHSIISGVTEVMNTFGRAIVLEDDLILSENFLSFMNQGLDKYEKEQKVFSVCGYTNKVKIPNNYTDDAYFCVRSSSWGWATWADRWSSVDWELKDWKKYATMKYTFNKWGGSDCFGMLKRWKDGRNQSWAIRFCFAQFLQDKLSLFPTVSKIYNIGYTADATNCHTYNRFKSVFDYEGKTIFKFPDSLEINKTPLKSALSYHSIPKRIYSRIRYILER